MKLYLNGKDVNTFAIKTNHRVQEETAKKYFLKYVKLLTGKGLQEESENIVVFNANNEDDDFTEISLKGNVLTFSGGKRGIIYSVFTFLEKLGCRFYTPKMEKLPKTDGHLSDFSLVEQSPFIFRDVLDNEAKDKEWCLKNKINSDLWHTRKLKEEDGGAYTFVGIPAHSLTGEFLLKPFVESNPEFFALKDGKRRTDAHGQVCMTNRDAIQKVTEEVKKLLAKNPDKNIVSVSSGDNDNFCECEKCKQSIHKIGLTNTYFNFVNAVARNIKKEYPKVLIHTFAYEMLDDFKDGFEFEDNIMVQFCLARNCKLHSLTDESCGLNVFALNNLKKCTSICKNIFIWEYINCFKYQLFPFPHITHYREDIQAFRDLKVKGLFYEGAHRDWENVSFAGIRELKCYILSKLMWKPDMSKEEYEEHIREFCQAFYGEGYEYVMEYLGLLSSFLGNVHATYNCFDEQKNVVSFIPKEKTANFLQKARDLLSKALQKANETQTKGIKKLEIELLYYELFWTMKDILNCGDMQEKKNVLAKSKSLIDVIIKENIPITFFGQSIESQNAELIKMVAVPVSEWNYKW